MGTNSYMEDETQASFEASLMAGFFSLLPASLASAIAAGIYLPVSLFLESGDISSINTTSIIIAFFVVGPIALLISAIFSLVIGFLAVTIGAFFKLIRWWSCVMVGFCIPFFGGASTYWKSFSIDPLNKTFWVVSLWLGFCGACGGFAFWLSWKFLLKTDGKGKIPTFTEKG